VELSLKEDGQRAQSVDMSVINQLKKRRMQGGVNREGDYFEKLTSEILGRI